MGCTIIAVNMGKSEKAVIADTSRSSKEVLNSWKEIAVYLNRGVRTVQRWEADLGLPVRRPRGKRHSSVIATRADLDAWLASSPLVENHKDGTDGTSRVKLNRGGARFLFIEIESGLTFAHLAASAAPNQIDKIQRNIRNAREAYKAVLKFRDQVDLDETGVSRLNAGMEKLKTALDDLNGAA